MRGQSRSQEHARSCLLCQALIMTKTSVRTLSMWTSPVRWSSSQTGTSRTSSSGLLCPGPAPAAAPELHQEEGFCEEEAGAEAGHLRRQRRAQAEDVQDTERPGLSRSVYWSV